MWVAPALPFRPSGRRCRGGGEEEEEDGCRLVRVRRQGVLEVRKKKRTAAASRPRPAGRLRIPSIPVTEPPELRLAAQRCPALLLDSSSAAPASLFLPRLHSIAPRTKCARARFVS